MKTHKKEIKINSQQNTINIDPKNIIILAMGKSSISYVSNVTVCHWKAGEKERQGRRERLQS